MEYIKDNYLRGYGSGPTWRVEIDPATRPVGTYYEEACKAAEIVWSQKQGELFVLYSGGMDSEYVINVFLSLGMKVTPVVMRLQKYNAHDTDYAYTFLRDRGLTHYSFDLNFDQFVESGQMRSIAEASCCATFGLSASMWLAKQLDGTILTGNDPPLLRTTSSGRMLEELQYIHSQFNFYKKESIYGTPFFLSYTPEMMLSFLKNNTIQHYARGAYPQCSDTNQVKAMVYNDQNKFKITNRIKYTGYEQIMKSKIFKHGDVQALCPREEWNGVSYFKYNEIVRWMEQLI